MIVVYLVFWVLNDGGNEYMEQEGQCRLEFVRQHVDNVLKFGRDCYHMPATPLFADGIDLETRKHISFIDKQGTEMVSSNLANQQNLFRTCKLLSQITENPKYEEAAKKSIQYHFDHLVDSSGLLQWGGHRWIDLKTLQPCGEEGKGTVHELKNHFPYYELMFEVDPLATQKFIRGFWNAHVLDWGHMEISRHGEYGLALGLLWDHTFLNPKPFRKTKGLSFLNAGNDLIYSAGLLYQFTKDEGAFIWMKRLAKLYVEARHPETGLGSYQFTQAIQGEKPPEDPMDPTFTHSGYGDRAQRQLGPEFGEFVLEGRMILQGQGGTLYVRNAMMQMELFEKIGDEAKELLEWTVEGLKAFYHYGYIKELNHFRPMLTDGRDLTNHVLQRRGYYGEKGKVLESYWANFGFLHSYTRGFRLTKDLTLWSAMRQMAKANNLGDIGETPTVSPTLHLNTKVADPNALLAVLEMYDATKQPAYLSLAQVIGDNMIKEKFHNGFFVSNIGSRYISLDKIEPLVLLKLHQKVEESQK